MIEPTPYPLEQNVNDILFNGIGSRFSHWLLSDVKPSVCLLGKETHTFTYDCHAVPSVVSPDSSEPTV